MYYEDIKMLTPLSFRADENLLDRLNLLSAETGRSKSYYIKKAINQFLEDREDYLLGLAAIDRNEPTITLSELEQLIGL